MVETSGQPSSLATAEALLSRYPSAVLLREYAVKTLSARELELLPSSTIDSDIYALRLAELLVALGIDVVSEPKVPTAGPSEFTAKFLPTHRMFFDAVCEAMVGTRTLRVTIMGPTFLLPEFILDRRDREKPGRNFTRELKVKLAGQIDFAHIVLRNSRERFLKMVTTYIESGEEFSEVIDTMLQSVERLRRAEPYPSLRFRCVDTGYMHIPHIFDNVALLGSRRSPQTAVDGGWVVSEPLSVDLEKTRFDRVFEGSGQAQSEALSKLKAFLESLL